jgi:selenocysteine lyase/cysteine desulfurase
VHTRLRATPLKRCSSISGSSDSNGEESGSSARSSTSALPIVPTQSLKQLLKRKLSTRLTTSRLNLSTEESLRHSARSVPFEEGQGYVVSCTFHDSHGHVIPPSHISRLACDCGISLRTGCLCNPGATTALREHEVHEMEQRSTSGDQVELKDTHAVMDDLPNAGVVRFSLGLVSNFEDVWRLVCWAQGLLDETKREMDLQRLNRLRAH